MTSFAVLATHDSYRQHLRPVAEALGALWIETKRELPDHEADVWITASARDFVISHKLRGAHLVMEHGCGLQWYSAAHVKHLARADAIAAPNQFIADRYLRESTARRVEVVGTPKMDALVTIPHASDGGTVAVSFHWTGMRSARTIPKDYRDELVRLASHTTVLGHSHPRFWEQAQRFYASVGIEPVREFTEIVARADVYACDHSSTIYEWAALDRPVILLEGRGGARVVPHSSGLRYTMFSDVGPTATPETLTETALLALSGDPEHREARRAATVALFPFLGCATERVVALAKELA